jgi:hypothetical protein
MRREIVQMFNKLGDVSMVGHFWHVPSLFYSETHRNFENCTGHTLCFDFVYNFIFFRSEIYSAKCGWRLEQKRV